jgi:hypothetical protein
MTDHFNSPAQGTADDTAATARLLADWRKAVASEIAALEATNAAPSDQDAGRAWDDALTRVRALGREAWARPVSGPADLRLRAEIAQHCLWSNYYEVDGTRRFEAVLNGKPDENRASLGPFDERAVAELVKAVLWTVRATAARTEPAVVAAGTLEDGGRAVAWGLVEDLTEQAKVGLMTLRTLWNSHASVPLAERPGAVSAFGPSMEFVVDGVEALLDEIAVAVAPAAGAPRKADETGAPPPA